jgi:hypothetical protein
VSSTSTWQDLGTSVASRRRRWVRRGGFTLLALIVAAGLFGLLGPRERTSHAEGDGYKLDVVHGSIVRSGQPVPLEVTVEAPMPFDGPVTLALDATLFDVYDFQNWYPNPDSETRSGDMLTYEFSQPDGQRFELHLDARAAPNLSMGPEPHWVALVVDDVEVARVEYDVWVAP